MALGNLAQRAHEERPQSEGVGGLGEGHGWREWGGGIFDRGLRGCHGGKSEA
jgi:hypothetical protein